MTYEIAREIGISHYVCDGGDAFVINDEIIEQRVVVIDELKQLENDELVKRYLELKKENHNLYDKQLRLYGSIKKEEYDECKHILVYSKIYYDRYEGRTYRSCGCIKCGLDNSVLDKERKWLTPTQQIMYDYLRKNHLNYFNGIKKLLYSNKRNKGVIICII